MSQTTSTPTPTFHSKEPRGTTFGTPSGATPTKESAPTSRPHSPVARNAIVSPVRPVATTSRFVLDYQI